MVIDFDTIEIDRSYKFYELKICGNQNIFKKLNVYILIYNENNYMLIQMTYKF